MGGSARYRLGKKIANAKMNGASQSDIDELERRRQEAIRQEQNKRYEIKPDMSEKEIMRVAKGLFRKARQASPYTTEDLKLDDYIEHVKTRSEYEGVAERSAKEVYQTYESALNNQTERTGVDTMVRNIIRRNRNDISATMENSRIDYRDGRITKEEFDRIGRQLNAIAEGRKRAIYSARDKWYGAHGIPKPKTGLAVATWENQMMDDLERE